MARDRQFTISIEDYETEDDFRSAVRQAKLDCEAIGHREGGAFVSVPIRMEREASFVGHNGEPIRNFVTIGWTFSHTFMPAAKQKQVEPGAELADELEAVLDEELPLDLDEDLEAKGLEEEPAKAE